MAEKPVYIALLNTVNLEFLPEKRGLGSFAFGDDFQLEMCPARLGVATEATALLKRCRAHQNAVFEKVQTVNTVSIIPFGSEPEVRRQWVCSGNTLNVTSDIRIGSAMAFNRLENGSFHIQSDWIRCTFLTLDRDHVAHGIQTHTVQRNAQDPTQPHVLYDAPYPPLSLLVYTATGAVLEVSCGEDLWRQFAPPAAGGTSHFTLIAHDNTLEATRLLGQWNESQTFSQRSWRQKWHIAYLPADYRETLPTSVRATVKLDYLQLPLDAQTHKLHSENPCLMATQTMGVLRKKIRSYVGAQRRVHIKCQNWLPQLCEKGAHCGRPNSKTLLHWDITEMLDFFLWSNIQLKRMDSTCTIEIDKHSPAAILPSMIALRYPNWL